MLRALMLTFAVFPALTACLGSGAAGLRIPELPPQAEVECAHPAEFLGAGDWEIIAGRIGDELITCEGRRALAAEAYQGVQRAAR